MLARLGTGIALASMTALLLAGCTPDAPVESTPPPTSTPAPTAEQLVEQIRDSWDSYQRRLSEVGAQPASATSEPLLEVATPDHVEFLLENFQAAADRRIHTEGQRTTTAFELADTSGNAGQFVVALCEDLSGERLVGDEGEDLTPPDQGEPRSRSVTFVESDEGDAYLVSAVTNFEGLTADDPCL